MSTGLKLLGVLGAVAVSAVAVAQVPPGGGQVSGFKGSEPMKVHRDVGGGTVPALQAPGAVSGVRGKDNQPHLTTGGQVSGVRGKDNQPHLTPGAADGVRGIAVPPPGGQVSGVRGIAVPEPGGTVSGVRGKEPMKQK